MKGRLISGVLALAILAGGAALAFAASQSETLVSLSYLNGLFWDDLEATVKQDVVRDTTEFYNSAVSQAGQAGGTFVSQAGTNGDRITGTVGSGLIWASGSGVVQAGTLIDATAGSEVNAGGTLAVGHRYLAGTDVTVAVSSASAQWMSEGRWTSAAGEPVAPPVVMPFTDVDQGAWYYADVAYVYEHGLFNGVTGSSFGPGGRMQRCMMTTVLHRLAGTPQVSYSALFQDIPDGQWYTAGTIWAGSQGVVSGVGDGRFAPFSNVTRQEIAVILYRYAAKMGYDVSHGADLSRFADAGAVADWGRAAVAWAVDAGILNGSQGSLLPCDEATRAEVSAILHRFAVWTER